MAKRKNPDNKYRQGGRWDPKIHGPKPKHAVQKSRVIEEIVSDSVDDDEGTDEGTPDEGTPEA